VPGFLHVTAADMAAVGPETFLCVVGIALILLDAFAKGLRPSFPYVTLAGVAVANFLGAYPPGSAFGGAIEASELTRFVDLLALAAVALATLGGAALLERDRRNQGEFHALLLWSAAGLMLMAKGNDLLVVFIGLELMSLGLYVLAAWYRDVPEATEAGMKYFLMGALASTFLLYGVATVYGRLGSTRLTALTGALASGEGFSDPLLQVGLLAILSALAFKVALVPFHSWAPDVYQGMTTPAVAFLSTAPKAAAVVVMIKVLGVLAPAGLGEPWRPLLSLLAVLSILFGNVVALAQRDLKRMLAYSGIAQMGYVAIGLATFDGAAFEGILVFLAGYLATNVAAFLAVGALSNGEKEPHPLADLGGLGRTRPFAASVLTLAMLSLTGLPPTIGFIGKLLVFRAAIDAGLMTLALVGIFGSLVSAGYYLRVVYYLWMKEPTREVAAPEEDVLSGAAFILVSVAMLVLGVLPRPLLDMARAAARSLPY
jgi:NADH-quinone oxidoreductase subunit N